MDMLLTFFGSLTEPVRLALIGGGLILGAFLLRRFLVTSHHALEATAKASASAK
jgi:hypothetical protein